MIVSRLRSEARGGPSSGSSTRYSSGGYGNKTNHGQHVNDAELKRALQYSCSLQTVRKWEKRWVVIHETSMRVHKWMPAPTIVATLASQAENTVAVDSANNNHEPQQTEVHMEHNEQYSTSDDTQDTQMVLEEESTSQSNPS